MIELQGINRFFQVGSQEVHALDNVTLSIEKDDYLSIMGPSGSGKSTLLNILGLLDQPTSGKYILDGQDITTLSDDVLASTRRKKIGFVFQFFHLLPRLTAQENVELPMMLEGISAAERSQRAGRMLETMGLADRAHHKPEELSGGQRQRVAIARATVMEPNVILADEPTGNLDRHSGHDVIEILEELNRKGMALVIVTHDPDIGQRARRRIHMIDGRIDNDDKDVT
jgi:putative ABC transport system ATP-binding protein